MTGRWVARPPAAARTRHCKVDQTLPTPRPRVWRPSNGSPLSAVAVALGVMAMVGGAVMFGRSARRSARQLIR